MSLWAARDRLARLGRPFQRLLVSDVLMLVALMISQVTMPWWIATQGGAPHLVLYVSVLSVVAFIALPLLSPLGDRVSKRVLMSAGLGLMTVQSVLLAVLAQMGIYRIEWIIVLMTIEIFATSVIMPASLTIAAELLAPEQLTEGVGYQKSAQALGRMIGPMLGGGLIAAVGISTSLWFNAVMLVVASVQAARIVLPPIAKAKHTVAQWITDLRAGLAAKWHIPMERGWTFVSFLVMIFFVPGTGMLVPLKVQSLGLSAAWLGACEAGLSLGMLVGSLGGSAWLARRVGRFRASFGSVLGEGVCLVVAGFTHQPWLMALALSGFGFCVATTQLVGHTHRTLAMPQDFRARMMAVNMMVMQLTAIIGPGLAGIGLANLPVDQVYMAFGGGLFLVGLGYTFVPGYKNFLNLPHAEAVGFYERLYPGLFKRGGIDEARACMGAARRAKGE